MIIRILGVLIILISFNVGESVYKQEFEQMYDGKFHNEKSAVINNENINIYPNGNYSDLIEYGSEEPMRFGVEEEEEETNSEAPADFLSNFNVNDLF